MLNPNQDDEKTAALKAADDWLTKHRSTPGTFCQPDPIEVINKLRAVLGRPKIVSYTMSVLDKASSHVFPQT
jgi:hypothetical protein